MSFHRSHPPTQSLRDASSAIGLRAEEQIARLSLLQSERLGPWALGWVLQHFPSASDFWQDGHAAQGALARWCHTRQPLRGKPKDLTAVLRQIEAIHPKRWPIAPKLYRWLENNNHHVLWSLHDERYPEALLSLNETASRQISEDPSDAEAHADHGQTRLAVRACRALFVEGNPEHLQAHGLAIVGGRACSDRAAELARDFAAQLASNGLSIISGMAEGIDAAAHLGALQAKGVTVAVMGTGIDRNYPRQHLELRQQIAQQDAVISHLLPGQNIEKFRFLQRNRFIAALAVAVLVVQARQQSGALSTAQSAIEQGKTVFAVPGSIDDPRSKGCHVLIRQGACLTERIEDIYSELPWLVRALRRALPAEAIPAPAARSECLPWIAELSQRMGQDAFDVHQLAALMQSSYEQALVQSLRWELEGHIRREPNGRYVLKPL
ncbi:MAG: DNA-protecting protein DprA [Betaproteobacteria bacterium]|nr:DNA-protecting protein DprA [Betaproteobacteria bacterium]